MRLLKTGPYVPGREKLEIIQVWGRDIPPYAILSHRWSKDPEDEVLFADVQNGSAETKPAYAKLERAMHQARARDGWQYLWIDTCCIDKTSSVELSEAINSMYMYYKNAEKCYAYLFDVSDEADLENSQWWGRGWTLQELLAPTHVEFFTGDWRSLGTKVQLCQSIFRSTGIDTQYLTGSSPVQYASVAKRMSWAARRRTTREEDMAYCLMGLFDVNMSMLYGEGATKAFLRLQEEIMKSSEDQSLFAWIKSDAQETGLDEYHGLLADSPSDFRHAQSIVAYSQSIDLNPAAMTARGVHLSFPLSPKTDGTVIAALQCPVPGRGYNDWLAIYLRKLGGVANQHARVNCGKLASISELGQSEEVFVRQHFSSYNVSSIYPYHFFRLHRLSVMAEDPDLKGYTADAAQCNVIDPSQLQHFPTYARETWSKAPLMFMITKAARALSAAILIRRNADDEAFVLLLGSSSEFEVGFNVCEEKDYVSYREASDKFSPSPEGTQMHLEYHNVSIRIAESIGPGHKVYNINLEIEAIGKPAGMSDVLQDMINMPLGKASQSSKLGLKGQVRRLWQKS